MVNLKVWEQARTNDYLAFPGFRSHKQHSIIHCYRHSIMVRASETWQNQRNSDKAAPLNPCGQTSKRQRCVCMCLCVRLREL
jgi:hypothetical protein